MSIDFHAGWNGQAIFHVLHHMRPSDWIEVFSIRPDNDVDTLFAHLVMMKAHMPFCEIVYKPTLLGRPVAFLAVTLESPGVARAHLIATPEMRPRDFVTWQARLIALVPEACLEAGLRRLHCSVYSEHKAAQSFLRACRWECEAVERALGRNGEDFQRWTAHAEHFTPQLEMERLQDG